MRLMTITLVAASLWAIAITTGIGWYRLITHVQSIEMVLGISSIIAVGALAIGGAIKRRSY